MKIFTLLTQILKMITGQTSRNLAFKSSKLNAQSIKQSFQGEMLNVQGLMPIAQPSTPNSLHTTNNAVLNNFSEPVPQKSRSLKNTTAQIKNESVSLEYKLLPVQKIETSFSRIKSTLLLPFKPLNPSLCKTFSPL